MKRLSIYLFGAIIVWHICFLSLAKADVLTAYLFERNMGQGIAEVTRTGRQYFKSKLKGTDEAVQDGALMVMAPPIYLRSEPVSKSRAF